MRVKHCPSFNLILATNIACLSNFIAGGWISWASLSLSKLIDTEPDVENIGIRLNKYEISWMACLLDLGNTVSPILTCLFFKRIGRKVGLYCTAIFFSVPILFLIFNRVEFLYLARFSVGFSKGMAFTILPLYISEVSDANVRGTLVSLLNIHLVSATLLTLIIGPYLTMKQLNTIFCILPCIFIFLLMLIPESPYYLASVKKIKEAEKSLKWCRGREDVTEELKQIIIKAKEDMNHPLTFKELFTNCSNRRAVFITLVISCLHRLCGATAMIVFGPQTFPETDISFFMPKHASFILSLVVLIGYAFQFRLPDILGRRPIIYISSLAGCGFLLVIAIYFRFPSTDYSLIVYISLILYGFFYFGISAAPSILVGELFPINIRDKASALSATGMALGSFTTTKFHLLIISYTSTYVVFFIYSFLHFVYFLFSKKYIFETKCKTFEEIQIILSDIVSLSKGGRSKDLKMARVESRTTLPTIVENEHSIQNSDHKETPGNNTNV